MNGKRIDAADGLVLCGLLFVLYGLWSLFGLAVVVLFAGVVLMVLGARLAASSTKEG